jgi:hypothetical protein
MTEPIFDGRITKFLDSPNKWTQEAYARDANGKECDECDPKAVCFCAAGLLEKFYSNDAEFLAAQERFAEVIGERIIAPWNDAPGRTFEDVRDAFARAGL